MAEPTLATAPGLVGLKQCLFDCQDCTLQIHGVAAETKKILERWLHICRRSEARRLVQQPQCAQLVEGQVLCR